jgi:SAM-dependent methyltransferase
LRIDPSTFEEAYARDGDPWHFGSSAYELDRYATTIDLLEGRYDRCFEPGCSIGVLTERLAAICDEVVAVDPAPSAIAAARGRLADANNVELHLASIPEWWPTGSFDLIVISELGYYWDVDGLTDLAGRLDALRAPTGDLVAVHWLGHSPDHLLHGADVHAVLDAVFGSPDHLDLHELFVAAAWRRR